MSALSVQINNAPAIVGGANDLGVLIASVACSGKLGTATASIRSNEAVDLHCRLGGLTSRPADAANEHLTWIASHNLKVGDTVRIEILEANACDPAVGRKTAKRDEDAERTHFEHCKQEYLKLRAKYETE